MPQTQVTDYEINEWTDLSTAPATVTANGNRSYSLVFTGRDYTGLVQPGTRIRTTRTVAAPTQCTSLNGSTQYFNKTSPAGMTFTDDFVVSAWVKLSSYANGTIASRYNGTSGWRLLVLSTGQIQIMGMNGGAANYSKAESYQSIPLNKWVHVAAQLDMSSFTATTTTSYIMIDGVNVPATVARGGTNPTALVQAGNLEIGTDNATNFFPGKIAQVAIYSAKVTQANVLATISQGLAGNETSLISAYSFNNAITDLNTTNANNLTAQGSAVATNADSPFGGQAIGTISSTLDYGIVQSASFSTNTTLVVQVPEGCTIPTSGGVSTVAYSGIKVPYGMPTSTDKWEVLMLNNTDVTQSSPSTTVYNLGSQKITVPIGVWDLSYQVTIYTSVASGSAAVKAGLSTTNNTFADAYYLSYLEGGAVTFGGQCYRSKQMSLSSATAYYLNTANSGGTTPAAIYNFGARSGTVVRALLSNL